MEIKIKIVENGTMPKQQTVGSVGFDCVARTKQILPNNKIKYMLGFQIEVPNGYVALIFPRSSVYKQEMILSNCVGVIDTDFRGEVSAIFKKCSSAVEYEVGDRCCQMLILPAPKVTLISVAKLSDTDRGSNGYGSTGK